jgi:hypothetical protein
METTRRNLLKAGAWSMPVIALAVAAPAHAASLATLTQRVVGPNLNDVFTYNALYFTNNSSATIPAGSLTVTLIDESADWNYGGFSSSGAFSYGAITGSTTSFILTEDLAVGAETPLLLLVLHSTLPAGGTARSAPLTVTAPGFTTLSFAVTVLTPPAANG